MTKYFVKENKCLEEAEDINVIMKGNFAVISGKIALSGTETSQQIAFPSGFNAENTMLVSAGINMHVNADSMADSHSYTYIRMQDQTIGVAINDNGIYLNVDLVPSGVDRPYGSRYFKILLMKITDIPGA